MGNGADGTQTIYGVVNLLLWPISPIWEIPQLVIGSKTINERSLIFYYEHKKNGWKVRKFEKETKRKKKRTQKSNRRRTGINTSLFIKKEEV